ncbi:hypothetical protein NL676_009134 [Syzygium grande]|nr:hypothetical protein NL676_009134 [Syzygium grande]
MAEHAARAPERERCRRYRVAAICSGNGRREWCRREGGGGGREIDKELLLMCSSLSEISTWREMNGGSVVEESIAWIITYRGKVAIERRPTNG